MSESLRSRLVHALLSLLMAVGLLIPLLGILDSSLPSPAEQPDPERQQHCMVYYPQYSLYDTWWYHLLSFLHQKDG